MAIREKKVYYILYAHTHFFFTFLRLFTLKELVAYTTVILQQCTFLFTIMLMKYKRRQFHFLEVILFILLVATKI